jgi:hypothetical protein
LIEASVWMKFSTGASPCEHRADDALRDRLPDAERIADRKRDVAGLDILDVGDGDRLQAGRVDMEQRDVDSASTPRTRAGRTVPSTRPTSSSVASLTTWWLVTMSPSRSITTPEPRPLTTVFDALAPGALRRMRRVHRHHGRRDARDGAAIARYREHAGRYRRRADQARFRRGLREDERDVVRCTRGEWSARESELPARRR